MNPENIICPTCNCKFNIPYDYNYQEWLECLCPKEEPNSISKDLQKYSLSLDNMEIYTSFSRTALIVNVINLYNELVTKSCSINAIAPIIIENNILQINKMIDKFNLLYTLS